MLFFQGHDLVDAPLVALVMGKLGGDPGVHDLQGQHLAHHTGTQCHHIGVVVLPGHPGGHHIGKQGAANALDLVCADGDAYAGAADDDTLFALAGVNSSCSSLAIDGIIAAIGGISTIVLEGIALGLKVLYNFVFKFKSAVVSRN